MAQIWDGSRHLENQKEQFPNLILNCKCRRDGFLGDFQTNCQLYYLLCFQFGESKGAIFTLTHKVTHQTKLSHLLGGEVGYFSATEPLASGQTSSWTNPELSQSHLKSLIKNLQMLEVPRTFLRLMIFTKLYFPLSLSKGKLNPFSIREKEYKK